MSLPTRSTTVGPPRLLWRRGSLSYRVPLARIRRAVGRSTDRGAQWRPVASVAQAGSAGRPAWSSLARRHNHSDRHTVTGSPGDCPPVGLW